MKEYTIKELQEGMASGEISAHSITQRYLERIEKIDRNGPRLNSIIELNPDALSIADKLDVERKEKGTRGPLHGIPVLIKDIIDTADKMTTTAGSLALVGSKPLQDSFVAQKLREAGAVIRREIVFAQLNPFVEAPVGRIELHKRLSQGVVEQHMTRQGFIGYRHIEARSVHGGPPSGRQSG